MLTYLFLGCVCIFGFYLLLLDPVWGMFEYSLFSSWSEFILWLTKNKDEEVILKFIGKKKQIRP